MKLKPLVMCSVIASLTAAPGVQAFDVVEAGKPVVTGEPSRVGPPWNHRSTLNIPGTGTDIAFGGYVKLDALYDADYDLGDATSPYNVNNPANALDGKMRFTALESRLNFRTQTKTDVGTVKSYVEVHFLPDGKFNLRHAYGELNGFLAGQTWSNFQSFVGATRTLALGDPQGYVFQRHPQVRYTSKNGPNMFAVALENPQMVVDRTNAGDAAAQNQVPDLTLRYQRARNFSVSGIVRQLGTDKTRGAVDDSVVGYGAMAMASLPLGSATTLKGTATYGSGIGNYMGNPANSIFRSTPDVYVDNSGNLETVDITGLGVSLNHNWNASWFSSVGYSTLEQDLPGTGAYNTEVDTLEYAFANVIWDITARAFVGLEYQYVNIDQVGGTSNDASRLQASASFQF
ncbi:porin [Marinobacter algicola]|uniref:porin n=1 Tax=Marinobacter algicola TaxID=236100 RepID=UPI003BAB4500